MFLICNIKVHATTHQFMQIYTGHRHKFPGILQSTTGLLVEQLTALQNNSPQKNIDLCIILCWYIQLCSVGTQ